MLGRHKLNAQAKLSIAVLVLIGLAIVGYALFGSSGKSGHNYTSELVYADYNEGNISLADKTGKQTSKSNLPEFNLLNYQAIAPNGGVLVNLNGGMDNESFIFTHNNTQKTFTGDSAKLLSSAVLVQDSHQMFFKDENTVLFTACADSSASCSLHSFNVSNSTNSKLLDTGVKQASQHTPSVYLVGYAPTQHLAYVRVVNSANKFGSSTNAIYEIDINNSKVTRNFNMPPSASSTATLSPDGNKLAYITYDTKGNSTVNVLDLSNASVQKVSWNKGPLSTDPGALKWSPDSSKILTQNINIVKPSDVAANDKTQAPVVIAYIDLTSNNAIHTIQQINDPSQEAIGSLGWLDNSQIVYQMKKSTKVNGLAGTTNQTVKQKVSGGAATTLQTPSGDLTQVALY